MKALMLLVRLNAILQTLLLSIYPLPIFPPKLTEYEAYSLDEFIL
jgi:hypothetical protein